MSASTRVSVAVYKLAAPRKEFFVPTFFSVHNTRRLRQKAVGACLYMPPQDAGHWLWLASFEVIPPRPPPQKFVFKFRANINNIIAT